MNPKPLQMTEQIAAAPTLIPDAGPATTTLNNVSAPGWMRVAAEGALAHIEQLRNQFTTDAIVSM
jgi:hypothetical protein|tara:strand:- start:340 stop:534 length:195 start_codon:yes stop_codon:yes gene_type:complete